PNTFNFIDLSNQKFSTFTDISGFTEVGPFPANMTARNLFRGPGAWYLTTGFSKKFFITERYQLQFRGEMYNAFNHANLFINPSQTDISAFDEGAAYVPARRDGRRNVQLALKLIF
ncbi:MAG TPA: hypothetical protein VKE91_17905, partial [Blastocatellia bacterium]|nr:hypothetical protein [Blastocatellia bacterium]